MAQINTGKYKVFADAGILYGPSGVGQNLNVDLEKALADELDAIYDAIIGDGIVAGLAVSDGGGLDASVAAGVAVIAGQRVSQGIASTIAMTDNTAAQKVYVSANTPWSAALRSWPLVLGKTTGSIPADSILLATVTTASGAITVVTDGRGAYIEDQVTIAGTIDDTVTPADAAISIRKRLGMLANMIKQATGSATWRTAPVTTIAAIASAFTAIFNASTGHAHDGTAGGGAQVSHADLADLAAGDPHTQYAKLAGDQFTGDVKLKKSSPSVRWIGTEGSAKDFQIVEVAGALKIQRNDGTEGTPVWTTILLLDATNMTVDIVTGAPLRMRMALAASVTATPSDTGGTLTTNSYYYKIVGVDIAGNVTAPSVESAAAPVTGPNGSVAVSWPAIPGAVLYRIYKGLASGAQDRYFTSTTNSYADTSNGTGTAGSVPAATAFAFHTFLSADGDGWIGGQTIANKRNLHIGHQLRLDTMANAALVLPTRYAQS
jgi:hypothetical protein